LRDLTRRLTFAALAVALPVAAAVQVVRWLAALVGR
jgi:hypothetical protein